MGATRLGPLIVVPVAAAVYFAAFSPSVGQRLPRFLVPALATIGGVLVVVSFARLVRRLARGDPADRPGVARALLSLVAVIVLAVLPGVRLVRVLNGPPAGAPLVLARFGDWLGSEGYPRPSAHRGVDIVGRPGTDVLAAADGRVTVARDNRDLCGLIVVLVHDAHGYRTVYCHLSSLAVARGDTVARGQRLGALGTSGQRAWPGYEHVHLELQKGSDPKDVEDPTPRVVGCFDERARYPTDRLTLTYPVRC